MTEIRTAIPEEVDAYLDALVRKGIFANKAELVRAALVSYVNATGTFFRGFDAENIFAPDGRLYQIEYAREAAARGGTAVGLVCQDGVLLAAETVPASRLSAPGTRKIRAAGDGLAYAYAGLVGDAALVGGELKSAAPKTTEEAVRVAQARLHRQTLERIQRPLGVALLLASVLERRPRLFYLDPSGAAVESLATAMGRGAPTALQALETKYRKVRLADAERWMPELLGRDTPVEMFRLEA